MNQNRADVRQYVEDRIDQLEHRILEITKLIAANSMRIIDNSSNIQANTQ